MSGLRTIVRLSLSDYFHERLLSACAILGLAAVLALAMEAGVTGRKFRFIYGFRPPAYNLRGDGGSGSEGSLKAPFSMHQYGKAADIVIDDDDDLVLDDLSADGRSDLADARALMKFVDRVDGQYRDRGDPRVGGAGVYGHNDFRRRKQSPYVHVDVRGFCREDGGLIRWTVA